MSSTLIEIRDLHKSFGEQEVLRGVNLSLPEGGITALIGKSGEGKSVLLKHLVDLLQPDQGEILFEGVSLKNMSRKKRWTILAHLSFMFQGMALFDSMTIEENISLPLKETLRLPPNEIARRVKEMTTRLEIDEVGRKYPSQLSGGMQRRVALARALVTRPKIVLFDEPTTGLDPLRTAGVINLIEESRRNFNFTAVIVTHDLERIFAIANRVAMLDEGKIIFFGSPEEIKESKIPIIREFLHGALPACPL